MINGKHGQGTHSTKIGSLKIGRKYPKSQNAQKSICPNFDEKRLHWASVVHGKKHYWNWSKSISNLFRNLDAQPLRPKVFSVLFLNLYHFRCQQSETSIKSTDDNYRGKQNFQIKQRFYELSYQTIFYGSFSNLLICSNK